jgi:hypothetical protein
LLTHPPPSAGDDGYKHYPRSAHDTSVVKHPFTDSFVAQKQLLGLRKPLYARLLYFFKFSLRTNHPLKNYYNFFRTALRASPLPADAYFEQHECFSIRAI